MKKITMLMLLFISMLSYGQIYEVPSCSNLGSNTYGPMNSVATANATNRTAVIYPSSQLTGIAGQVLNALYFKRSTASGTMGGSPNLKIYLKETTSTDWGTSGLSWDATITGATLVYDTNPASSVGNSAGWKSFPLSANFTYSGTQNLVVLMEYQNTAASTAIQWNYEFTAPCVNTSNSSTTKYSNNTSGTFPVTLSSQDYRRPLIGFDFNVSCNAPANVVASAITTTGATITWDASSSAPASGYDYYLSTTNTAPLPTATPTGSVGAGVTTLSLSALPPATTHYIWVRANCGDADKSIWRGINFTTLCAVLTPTVTESFTTFPPNCWTRAGAGDLSTGPTGTANGIWAADGFLNSGTTGAIKVNLYNINAVGWMITPTIDMSAGNYRAKFRIGSTDYNNTNPTENAEMPAGDVVIFAISEDNGTTWTALRTWEGANMPPNAGALIVVPLSTNVSPTTKFAFYANDGTIDTTDDYEIFIDDFAVETIPNCEAPINLVTSGVTNTSATISWDAVPGSVGYEYILDQVATAPTVAGTTLAATTHTESGTLSPASTYYFHVRNNCDGDFSNWSTISFTTRPNPPANDDCFAAVSLTVNANLACGVTTAGTLAAATDSQEGDNGAGVPDDDVWYSFVATGPIHTIALSNVSGTPTNLVHEVLDGICGGGLFSLLVSDPDNSTVTGLTPGMTYIVRVFSFAAATPATSTTFNICVGTPPPPPANDNCAGAIALGINADPTCTVVTAGTNAFSTASSQPATSLVGTPNNDVWYTFVATGSAHTVTLSDVVAVNGTSLDMAMGIYDGSGTCTALTFVATSDPNTVTVGGLTAGNTYYVRVYGYSVAQTNFNICVSTPPPPPANDECANAVVLTPSADLTCANPVAGTTIAATQSLPGCLGTADDDVWYQFVATAVSHNIIVTNATGSGTADIVTQVFNGCGGTSVVCQDTPNSPIELTGLTVGNIYSFRIYSWSSSLRTSFTVCVVTPPPPPPAPANDDCDNAIAVTVNPTLTCTSVTAGTNVSATASTQPTTSLAGVPSRDVWFSFVATGTQHVISLSNVVAVIGTSTDMAMGFYNGAGTCSALTFVSTSDPNSFTANGLTVGDVYYLRVYGYGAAQATFDVCVGTPPPPPANDICSSAVALTPGELYTSNPVNGHNIGATVDSSDPVPTCDNANFATSGKDVWYTVVVPASGSLTVETGTVAGTFLTDTGLQVYSGTCGALTSILCNADDGEGNFSKVVMTGLTAGNTLLVRVWGYNGTSGNFLISAYDASLSNDKFDSSNFKAYPNPVVDVLNLSYSEEMSSVTVFNLVGQQVLTKKLNSTEANIDMSNLAAGTYMVKVAVGNTVKTVKVLKN